MMLVPKRIKPNLCKPDPLTDQGEVEEGAADV